MSATFQLAMKVKELYDLKKHPFFQKVIANEVKPKELGHLMSSFYHAVVEWKEMLFEFSSLLTVTKHHNLVKDNIFDEMGMEKGRPCPQKAHSVTFMEFLNALGVFEVYPLSLKVVEFNHNIRKFVTSSETASTACFLGALELLYVDVSQILEQYCNNHNIQQTHYNVHSEMDQQHALNFFTIAEELHLSEIQAEKDLHAGFSLLSKVFSNFLDNH